MNEKVKCILSGFIGGILLCLGFAWGKKDNAGKGGDSDGGTALNSDNLRTVGNYITDRVGTDSAALRESIADLKGE
jgi:hypothetical protein